MLFFLGQSGHHGQCRVMVHHPGQAGLGAQAGPGRLSAVIRDFAALNAARKGEVTATVTAAHKLTAAQQKALGVKLKAGIGRDVALTVNIDPSILGGLIVRMGSQMIDSSIKTRLNTLSQAMKG